MEKTMWQYIKKLPLFSYQNGRHTVSLWVSRLVEKLPFKQLIGFQLVFAVVTTSILTPKAANMYTKFLLTSQNVQKPLSAEIHTKSTFFTPLSSFRISQRFSYWHPALDMTAPLGTPVYSIGDGVVEYIENGFFGYGKHVIVKHPHDTLSLYGHLSEVTTYVGHTVRQGDLLGKVGSTGWSSGNHLHLEIYVQGKTVNPLEVLPIDTKSITYESTAFSASPSAFATPSGDLTTTQLQTPVNLETNTKVVTTQQ